VYDGGWVVRIDRYLGEMLMGICGLVGSSLWRVAVPVGEEGVEAVFLQLWFVVHDGSFSWIVCAR
jgi:hypothetical protein